MVGGDEASVKQVHGLLSDIAAQVEYVGAAGSGSIAKLLNNFVALWGMVGVSQAFLAASRMDIEPDRLYQVMAKSLRPQLFARPQLSQDSRRAVQAQLRARAGGQGSHARARPHEGHRLTGVRRSFAAQIV